jgi:hypothetical protein
LVSLQEGVTNRGDAHWVTDVFEDLLSIGKFLEEGFNCLLIFLINEKVEKGVIIDPE